MQKIILVLKSEALAFFIACFWSYSLIGASWSLFWLLLLVPDIFMVGYAKNSHLGALIYNIGHSYIIPLLLLGLFILIHTSILLPISIIWIAHISMDRMLGYGLKFDTDFKDTHLGRIGQ